MNSSSLVAYITIFLEIILTFTRIFRNILHFLGELRACKKVTFYIPIFLKLEIFRKYISEVINLVFFFQLRVTCGLSLSSNKTSISTLVPNLWPMSECVNWSISKLIIDFQRSIWFVIETTDLLQYTIHLSVCKG